MGGREGRSGGGREGGGGEEGGGGREGREGGREGGREREQPPHLSRSTRAKPTMQPELHQGKVSPKFLKEVGEGAFGHVRRARHTAPRPGEHHNCHPRERREGQGAMEEPRAGARCERLQNVCTAAWNRRVPRVPAGLSLALALRVALVLLVLHWVPPLAGTCERPDPTRVPADDRPGTRPPSGRPG